MTENTLMERLEGALPVLTALRIAGFGVRPVLERGPSETAIVQAIVLMAKSLGKSIIAEGIETAAQAERLLSVGCQVGQGYFLSRPLTANQIDELLDQLRVPRSNELRSRPLDTVQSMWQ